jgi:dipeptidyl aminopeptidase/acylaminoacyl peptidase
MHILLSACLSAMLLMSVAADAAPRRPITIADMLAIRDVSEIDISADGAWIAYTVSTADMTRDESTSDIWMSSWDGQQQVQLTTSDVSDSHPRFSPDGRYIAFLSARDDEHEDEDESSAQVWLLDRAGGEARQLTALDGNVEDFAWSPDGARLALIVKDPDPAALALRKRGGALKGRDKTSPPIVIDRYRFKKDVEGYLGNRRSHLHLFDVAGRNVVQLTTGAFDDGSPAWSPDGGTIAFVTKRGADTDRHWNWDVYTIEARASATAKLLTPFQGADGGDYSDPIPGGGPRYSPDGRTIAYLRTLDESWESAYFGAPIIAVTPAAGGEARPLTGTLDRQASQPRWSADGRYLYFALEDDRSVQLARVPATGGEVERLTARGQVVREVAIAPGGHVAVVVTNPAQPAEVFALEGETLRPLSRQNEALVAVLSLGTVAELDVQVPDGTRVGALTITPPDFRAGKRYPTLLYIHGGPQAQDQHEFDPTAQLFAANGYLVVQANYRGSYGRGYAYSLAYRSDWGHFEVTDLLASIDAVVADGRADPGRLGILGWSYGGMLTNYTIASDTRFKAAVSGAGISNMLAGYGTDQYISDYEFELGLPWKSLDSYLKVSYPFFHADRIKTPVLFICGEKDFNVPLINSEQMYQALRSIGIETQLVIYPGEFHSISTPSYLQDLAQRHLDWFGKYLKSP